MSREIINKHSSNPLVADSSPAHRIGSPRLRKNQPRCPEDGFVLVAALMFLVILTLAGISATSTMQMEQIISRNDRLAQQNLYAAEGGIEAAIEVIEQNVACKESGFLTDRIKGVQVLTKRKDQADKLARLYINESLDDWLADNNNTIAAVPSDTDRDILLSASNDIAIFCPGRIPEDGNARGSHEAAQTGTGNGGSTVSYEFDIHSRQRGAENSEAIVRVGYRHRVGTEGECLYGD